MTPRFGNDLRAPNSADADLSRPKVTFESQRRLAALLLRGKLEQEYDANNWRDVSTSAPPGRLSFGEEAGYVTPPASADSDFAVQSSLPQSSSLKQLLRLGSLGSPGKGGFAMSATSPTRKNAADKTPRNENGQGRRAEGLALGHNLSSRPSQEVKMLTASVLSPQHQYPMATTPFLSVTIPSQGAFNKNYQSMPVSAPNVSVSPETAPKRAPAPGGGGLEVRAQRSPRSAVTDFGEFPAAREKAPPPGVDRLDVGGQRSPRSAVTDFGEFPGARDDEACGGLRRTRSPRGQRPNLQPNTPGHREQSGQLASGNPYASMLSASPFPWNARTPTMGDRAFWLDKFVPPERPRSTPPLTLYLPGEQEQQARGPEGLNFREARETYGERTIGNFPMRSPSGPPIAMVPQLHISQASPSPQEGDKFGRAEHVLQVRRREHSYQEGHSSVPMVSVSPVSPGRNRNQRFSAPSTLHGQHPQQSVPRDAVLPRSPVRVNVMPPRSPSGRYSEAGQQAVLNAPVARQAKSPTSAVAGAHSALWTAILEDFRTNKGRKYELRHTAGFAAQFAGDQNGSRFIQQKLETGPGEEKAAIIKELVPHALQLATDAFGNYVMQKLFEFGTEAQRVVLAKQIEGHVLSLSLEMYGCRVVQKALEYLPRAHQIALVRELEGEIVRCVKDPNGNHVIQKAVDGLPAEQIWFIFNAFIGQVGHLSAHPYGCRVVQRVLVRCKEDDKRSRLLQELYQLTTALALDQYGNYVVQHSLQHGTAADRSAVIARMKGQISALSRHKFASNVVEKCIAHGSQEDRHALIEEVISSSPDGRCALTLMVKDKFANYVVQRMLDVVEGEQQRRILDVMAPQLPALRKIAHGKHIISRVEKLARAIGYSELQCSPSSAGR